MAGLTRVIAIDPGGMTGVADYLLPEDNLMAYDLPAGQAMPALHRLIADGEPTPDLVVCENITITMHTAKKSQDVKISLEQIGIIRYLCWIEGVPFQLQPPGAKSFCPDETLKALDWWTRGSDHARDATRHLVKALATSSADFRERLVHLE